MDGIFVTDAELTIQARNIVEDVLYNIVDDIVRDVHREEKMLRMQSAAAIVEQQALEQVHAMGPPSVKGAPPAEPNIKCSTEAATFDNGRIFLKGNPLQTTPEIICPHCKLPRLHHPITGKRMQTPDLTKQYCMLYPWVSKDHHDIYGNPFPTDMGGKTKKERELLRQQQRAEKDNTPGSQDTNTPTDTIKLNTGGKPASYIPWHTCPNCKRSLLITRFAQHLEKCLGLAGRQSSRAAAALISKQNGTPLSGSRVGTPTPGSQGANGSSKHHHHDDDDDETPKKKKKSSYVKKADREKLLAAKRPPKRETPEDNGKRSREGDADGRGERERKKIKLGREESDDAASNIVVENGNAASPQDD